MMSKRIDDFINCVLSNSKIVYCEEIPDMQAVKFKILCIRFIDGDKRFYTGKTNEDLKNFYKNIGSKLHNTLYDKFCVQKMVMHREIMQIPQAMYETYAKILAKDTENALYKEIDKFIERVNDIRNK